MKAEYVDHMGTDLSVVNAARVSFDKVSAWGNTEAIAEAERLNQQFMQQVEIPKPELMERDKSLIAFLAKHDHWTPFGHTAITLRMAAPIPIRTQCFKHKIGFVENEESRRYISSLPEVFFPDWRQSTKDKKQGSGGLVDDRTEEIATEIYALSTQIAIDAYEELLAHGICEEQARFALPQGSIVNWIWTGNLMSFANFYNKRAAKDAQGEIQELAKAVGDLIAPLYPVAWAALTNKAHK